MAIHRTRSRADYIASLQWNIRDAKEALHHAIDMSSWANAEKYITQLKALERKLYDAEATSQHGYAPLGGRKRARRHETGAEQARRWEQQREYHRTGRRGLP
jgi:hypothetical protein